MPINARCGCGCGKLTRKRDANGVSLCTAAKRGRPKAPIKMEVGQDFTMAKSKPMDALLLLLGAPRKRFKIKASMGALVRHKFMKLSDENTLLKSEVACRTEEVAHLTGQLLALRQRFDLMEDTRDWFACARRANTAEMLPPTVARRVAEVRRGSSRASQI